MEGDGPSDADFMVIGESPSEGDDELNQPFVSGPGEYFRETLLGEAGIPESKVRFTNTIRCAKSKTPTVLEIKKCRPYLVEEINRVKPKVIVGLGNAALATMLQFIYKGKNEEGTAKKADAKVSGITRWRGNLIWLNEFNCWFMPTFSPLQCLMKEGKNSMYTTDTVISDLITAWKAVDKAVPIDFPKSVFLTTVSKVDAMLSKMAEAKIFAYDIETGGKGRAIDKRIIGASFSCSTKVGYYVPQYVFDNSEYLSKKLDKLLTDPRNYKIMHNGAYEYRIHHATGKPIYGRYFDTMIAAQLVDENFSKRLKDLTWLYTPIGGYDVELEKYKFENKIKEDYSLIPDYLLAPYGGFDAVVTYRLYHIFKKKMESEKVLPLFDKVIMPARREMSDAEMAGFYVDLDSAVSLGDICKKALKILEDNIYQCAGKEFNIGSSKQLQSVLFEDMGFTPLKETKSGYSTDKESIEYLSSQPNSEIVRYLSDRSYVSTMLNTHIGQAIAYTWPDHRVHTNYNLAGAVTGRTSASNPSLQNVPADRLVRNLYTATPGNLLVEADLKSAELATIAAVSGETVFIKAFDEGMDPHAATYRQLYDLPDTYNCTKLERRKAKAVNFGMVYGLTPLGLAAQLKISEEEAINFMQLYFHRMPNVAKWMENQKKIVMRDGYVTSVFGRKRRLPMALSDSRGDINRACRQAMNSPIQSAAADYTYIGLVRLGRKIRSESMEGKIVHTVHDCVITDTPEHEAEDMAVLIKESFEKRVKALKIQMRVDVETGFKWGHGNESRLEDIFNLIGLKVA